MVVDITTLQSLPRSTIDMQACGYISDDCEMVIFMCAV